MWWHEIFFVPKPNLDEKDPKKLVEEIYHFNFTCSIYTLFVLAYTMANMMILPEMLLVWQCTNGFAGLVYLIYTATFGF